MKPLNDLAKVQLETDVFGFGSNQKDTAESGILVQLPEKFYYFGMWSFAFEKSFMSEADLNKLLAFWKTKIGRKVYWTALSERGNIIEKDGQKFAFIKLTSLIAEDDPDSTGSNVHNDGSGSFGTEK